MSGLFATSFFVPIDQPHKYYSLNCELIVISCKMSLQLGALSHVYIYIIYIIYWTLYTYDFIVQVLPAPVQLLLVDQTRVTLVFK